MKSVGVVRKVDQLGRIVLPKSLRQHYGMNTGDPIGILVDGEYIILEKYYPQCVICGSTEKTDPFKGKTICTDCMNDISEMQVKST